VVEVRRICCRFFILRFRLNDLLHARRHVVHPRSLGSGEPPRRSFPPLNFSDGHPTATPETLREGLRTWNRL